MLLDEWVAALGERLEVPVEVVDVAALLDLARDAAHAVDRPAAPLTAFLVGYATARRGGDAGAAASAVRDATEAVAGWQRPP